MGIIGIVCRVVGTLALFALSLTAQQRWSNPDTWPGSQVPDAGSSVHIPTGQTVLLDCATAALDLLYIEGTLLVDQGTKSTAITANSIDVMPGGRLVAGSLDAPYLYSLTITLTGARGSHTGRSEDNALDNDPAIRGMRVMPGGKLQLFGSPPAILRTKLNDHAAAGATTLQAAVATGWRAGDRIAISTTDFYGVGATEILTIASTNGAAITTTTALATSRWGKLQYPLDVPVGGNGMSLTQGTWTSTRASQASVLDERAEIVNLTRNIVFQGADDANWQTQGFGAHLMVMGVASTAQIRGVEFRRCGQRRAMGRYPIHWHMLSYTSANAQGQGGGAFIADVAPGEHFARDCTVVGSENRAVTIHGTCGVQVDQVFAVDIKGHAFFLEDGSERRNAMTNCVAMKVRAPAQPMKLHDAEASGFWLTNPDNTIDGNSASDCQGRGLWNSYASACFGLSRNVPLNPSLLVIAAHEDNMAHGCQSQGIATEFVVVNETGYTAGQRYQPAGVFTLSRNFVWKNLDGGYLNRVGTANYIDWVAADNNTRDFQGQTMPGSLMRGTFMVGKSLNSATPFADAHRIGFASYHFTLDFEHIAALNYSFVAPTIAGNSQFVYGGGVFDTSDLYDKAIGLGTFRNEHWHLVNAHAGYITPPPYFDGFPIASFQAGKLRYWTLPGAIWDPHGYWGPAGNYLIPANQFYTYGLNNLVAVAPAGSNGWSTPSLFYGLADIVIDDDVLPQYAAWGGPSMVALKLERLSTANAVVAEHTVGDPAQAIYFGGMRYFSVAASGRYNLTFPSGRMPVTALRFAVDNAYRSTDRLTMCVPWPRDKVAAGRQSSGFSALSESQQVQAGIARLFVNTGTSVADVVNDPTGARIWQDTANSVVWLTVKGGLAMNVYGYDGRSEESLRQTQVIWLREAP